MADRLHRVNADLVAFKCPGCGCAHMVRVAHALAGEAPCWGWNGDMENPTFTPSVLCRTPYPDRTDVCHSFVTDGKITFLTDCTHSRAGEIVDIPAWQGWAECH